MSVLGRLASYKQIRVLRRADAQPPEVVQAAVERLAAAAPGSIPAVLDLLADRVAGPHAREVLRRALDDRTLPLVAGALGDERPAVARAAAEVLAASERYDPAPLLDLLEAPGGGRAQAEAVLLARGGAIPAPILAERLAGADREARASLVRILEEHGDASMLPTLYRLLEHEDWWLRARALALISRHPESASVESIRPLLRDPSKHVRLEAVRALAATGSEKAIPELCQALRDGDLKVHSAAIDALVGLGSPTAVQYLVDVLKDDSEYARRGAVEVLNEVATPDAVSDLVSALRDEDWWVRVRAADALGSLGGSRVVEAVLGLLESEDEFIRRYAVEILNTVPDARAVDALVKALGDPDWWVRERAIDALAKTGDPRAVQPLIDRMQADPEVGPLCARALGALGDERAVDPLCEMTRSEDAEMRGEALAALRVLATANLSAGSLDRIRAACGGGAARERDPLTVRRGGRRDPESPPRTDSGGGRPDRASASPAPEDTPAPAGPAAPPPARRLDRLEEGALLAERYCVLRRIGSGGFGTVYLVEDRAVSDQLILKILNPQISADESVIRRFVRELKLTRRIAHPNVIRIYDLVRLEGVYAISMEYFEGRDLGQVLRAEGRLAPARAAGIFAQIAAGLAAAHAGGIVHRDVKPANLLLGGGDEAKIVDFGLASMAQTTGSRLTKSGILIGTPQYMAPEQITGDSIDGRTDLYSLGVVMYEALAGVQPVRGENAVSLLFQHLEGEVEPLRQRAPEAPKTLADLVMRCLAREPAGRPADAAEVEAVLRECARGEEA